MCLATATNGARHRARLLAAPLEAPRRQLSAITVCNLPSSAAHVRRTFVIVMRGRNCVIRRRGSFASPQRRTPRDPHAFKEQDFGGLVAPQQLLALSWATAFTAPAVSAAHTPTRSRPTPSPAAHLLLQIGVSRGCRMVNHATPTGITRFVCPVFPELYVIASTILASALAAVTPIVHLAALIVFSDPGVRPDFAPRAWTTKEAAHWTARLAASRRTSAPTAAAAVRMARLAPAQPIAAVELPA